jgi:hypothetical protein
MLFNNEKVEIKSNHLHGTPVEIWKIIAMSTWRDMRPLLKPAKFLTVFLLLGSRFRKYEVIVFGAILPLVYLITHQLLQKKVI